MKRKPPGPGKLSKKVRATRPGRAKAQSEQGRLRSAPGRKQALKHFQQVNRALKMLSDCHQALVRAREEPELLGEMCRIIVEVGGYRMAWIGFKEDDPEKSVRPVAQAGYEAGYLETLKITWADTERGRGPTGTAIRTGRPATCQNMLTDPKFKPWRTEALKRGYASSLVLPLIVENQVMGALNIYAPEPDSFGTEELALLGELADNLAFGIQALRNRQALAATQKSLERRVEERTAELAHSNEILRLEIRERERTEEALRQSERELAIRNRIKEIFLTVPDQEMYGDVLQMVLEAFESKFGIFGYVREDGAIVYPSLTRDIWDQCQVPDKDIVFPRESWAGIWGRALTEKKSFRSNGPFRVPMGHIPITNFLVTPIVHQEELIGILNLANKATDYSEADQELLERIASSIAPVLKARLQRDREERERQRVEDAVRTAAEEWRKTFDAMPDLILLLDPEHRIVRVNQATAKTLGRSPAELIGRECFRCVHGTEAPIESCPHARTLSDGQEHTGEVYEASLGRHFLVSTTPLFDGRGHLTGSVHVMRDITERKRAEVQISKLAYDLGERVKELNCLYGLSEMVSKPGATIEEILQGTVNLLPPAFTSPADVCARIVWGRHEFKTDNFRETPWQIASELLVKDTKAGLLEVYYLDENLTPSDSPFLKEETLLINAVAERLGKTIERRRVEEELKKHREHLEELVEARTAEVHQVIKDLRTEITERKRAEEKLRQSEASLAEAQRMAHLGNWDWNIVSNELRWSDEIYRIFGLRPQEFGATYDAFLNSVHPEDRAFVTRSVDQALYENQPYSIEHRIVLPEGEVRVVQERAEVTFDPGGQPIRMIGTVQDITERKRAEEARDKAERELEEQRARAIHADRLRSLGEMAAGIAHELNQPLLGVRGLAEHILIGADRGWDTSPDKIKEKVNLIVEQSDRMTHIIERVRMFARGADNSELMPVQVNDVIRSGTGLLGAQARARGMTLECELTENLPEVLANPFSLEEVILNLINNARDATSERLKQEPGAAPPRIVLRTRAEPEGDRGKVVIDVKDQGVGIPPEILNRIFDPFFTTKAPDKGTGLGLSISKSIVESLGGMIEVQSAPGAGTTVSVSLPALTPGFRDRGKEKESP